MIPEIFLWKFLLASRPRREAAEEFDASGMFVICSLACIIFAARWIFCCPLQGWSAALWIRTVDLLLRLLINTVITRSISHTSVTPDLSSALSASQLLSHSHTVSLCCFHDVHVISIYLILFTDYSVSLFTHSLQRPGTCSAWFSLVF